MMEKTLIQRCLAAIPRDLDLLEQLVIEHKQFENDLSSHELEVRTRVVLCGLIVEGEGGEGEEREMDRGNREIYREYRDR